MSIVQIVLGELVLESLVELANDLAKKSSQLGVGRHPSEVSIMWKHHQKQRSAQLRFSESEAVVSLVRQEWQGRVEERKHSLEVPGD